MELFKGYVPTNNKKCTMPFKDKKSKDLLSLEEAQKFPEFAGILASNIVLVDVDNPEQAELLYKIVQDTKVSCTIYQTTRGKHFYFENTTLEKNFTGAKLACGITADIKLGRRNSYSVVRYNGVDRKCLNDSPPSPLPCWMRPIKGGADFLGMGEGDGRNQELFNYILVLQEADFTIEEIRETVRIINSYVLSVPLEQREIETILRDEAFSKPNFFKDKTFLFDRFANFLKSSKNICQINGQLHIYKNGIYVAGYSEIEASMIEYLPQLSRAKRTEVLEYLKLICPNKTTLDNANLIAFRNGVFDLDTQTLSDFSPEYLITNKIPWDYNSEAESAIVDTTLNKLACGDREIFQLLCEVVGYCFYRRNELRKSFILIGDKANGKSTFLDMINHLLGEENVSNLDLKDLGDRFSPASLFGMLANIGDDIGDDFINGAIAAQFKKIVSGSRIRGERKGQPEFFFDPYCKMIYSANNIPRIKDNSGAVLDRMIIVPFNASFSKNDPDFDPYIKYKLRSPEAMERLLFLGLIGLKRVLENQGFTVSSKVQHEIEEYELNNNPILGFFKEREREEIVNQTTQGVYQQYNEYCLINNFTPKSHIEFSKAVKKYYTVETKVVKLNGKSARIFTSEV